MPENGDHWHCTLEKRHDIKEAITIPSFLSILSLSLKTYFTWNEAIQVEIEGFQ